MGLTIRVNNFDSFDIGYMGFMAFRYNLAIAVNERLGELYKKWVYLSLTDDELNEMIKLAGDLMIFFNHSDCEGSFTPSESRKLYIRLKDIKLDYSISTQYHNQGEFNVLERLKQMFYYSWHYRRKIIFS